MERFVAAITYNVFDIFYIDSWVGLVIDAIVLVVILNLVMYTRYCETEEFSYIKDKLCKLILKKIGLVV